MPGQRGVGTRWRATGRGGLGKPAIAGAIAIVSWHGLLVVPSGTVAAREPAVATAAPRAADEMAIREASRIYQQAVRSGDRTTLAGLWMPDGDIIDAEGTLIAAADVAMEGDSAADGPQFEYRVGPTTLRFIGPDTAIEDGVVEIVPPQDAALQGRFSATWVRQGKGWKLAAVRESAGRPPTGREALADLAWMEGDWEAAVDPEIPGSEWPRIEITARWNDARTYLVRVLTLTPEPDAVPLQVTQRIGWDPVRASIHSWKFASDGAHGEADWRRDGASWVAEADTVATDGTRSSTLNIYTYDGRDRCRWRSVPTDLGGRRMTAVDRTLIRRPSSSEADARSER